MIRPGRKQTNWQPHGYQGFGFFIHGLWSGSPPDTRGRSPVRKSRTPGSVRGVSGNGYPYRDIKGGEISASDGGDSRSERPRKQTAPGFRKGELTGRGSVTPHVTKAALTSSVLFLPVLPDAEGQFHPRS